MTRAWPIVASLVATLAVLAHPSFVTMTQTRHNIESASLENALQIDAHDLEHAIEERTGEPIDLEKSPNADTLVREYVEDSFFVRTGDTSERARSPQHELAWIGFELEDEYAWLYFEISVPDGINGVHVSNQILFEVDSRQANTIILRHESRRLSLLCTPDSPWAQIQLSSDD
ncbi:MAG: DUF6702 family protein [Phycisphaerales bacterium JB043]